MVGFPGETEEEFTQSLAFAKEIGFAKAHVFAYSRRPGTRANDMPGQLTNALKEQRSKEMIAATQETQRHFFETQLGLTEPVLFERECRPGIYEGYTRNYTPVHAASTKNVAGLVLPVKLTEACHGWCEGTIENKGDFSYDY